MLEPLRLASAADAPAISQLVNAAYRPTAGSGGWTSEAGLIAGERISPQQVRELFADDSTILLLERDSSVIGCVHVQRAADAAYIGMLATSPALQAQGVGKQLLAGAERYATEVFRSTLFKMSVLSQRPELLAFYLRRGYCETGEIADFPIELGVGQPIGGGIHIISLSKLATS